MKSLKTFHQEDRDHLLSGVSDSVLAYLEALEAVAGAARAFFEITETQTLEQIDPSNALHDALIRVDFLESSESTRGEAQQRQSVQERAMLSELFLERHEYPLAVLQQSRKKFGDLLEQVCQFAGFTQEKLSREAKAELQRLREEGRIQPDDPVGSLEPPTIANVLAGAQAATYYQVYIWLSVIGKHVNSQEFVDLCKTLDVEIPDICERWGQWEQSLWDASSFVPPEDLSTLYEAVKDLQLFALEESQ